MSALVFIGGGGHGRACLEAARSTGLIVAGFIDRDSQADMQGTPWLGDDDWLSQATEGPRFLITVGQVKSAAVRMRLYGQLQALQLPLATLIASSAVVASLSRLGKGCAVLHHALINAGADVGVNCIINSGALIEHDAVIGAHSHVATGAIVNGGTRIGSRCLVGSRAVVLQGVTVADDVVIGAGAVVTADVNEAGTWVGVPARRVS
ncbi:acetyltransferase [Jeongeupia naejangsanensis]|uniref:Acetyltransferase n=1 Tax=Jeongeupia naejangsanensis TaxID=613195 RepID=A0ABS2BP38_9NEIS|nr:acetyltransferase [Jeongeupia naejangsanensis]MBM3117399.1 acetyltransferase [Jeongeupia naejangsanensis]